MKVNFNTKLISLDGLPFVTIVKNEKGEEKQENVTIGGIVIPSLLEKVEGDTGDKMIANYKLAKRIMSATGPIEVSVTELSDLKKRLEPTVKRSDIWFTIDAVLNGKKIEGPKEPKVKDTKEAKGPKETV